MRFTMPGDEGGRNMFYRCLDYYDVIVLLLVLPTSQDFGAIINDLSLIHI